MERIEGGANALVILNDRVEVAQPNMALGLELLGRLVFLGSRFHFFFASAARLSKWAANDQAQRLSPG
tara:strand:- start:82 stop:285 length:204 start_codon:yes stop_codon:yes gene_type:complete